MYRERMNWLAGFLCVTLLAASQAVWSQLQSTMPIVFDAANSETLISQNKTVFYRLRITQGTMRIEAEKGTTEAGTDFAESRWEFEGNVEIDINNAEIRADAATLEFVDYQLARADIGGRPATFSDINAQTGEKTEGQAQRFVYNLTDQIIRFEESARIRDARNIVEGKLLRYDLANQNIAFEGNEETGERVRITIQPPPADASDADLDDAMERAEQTLRESNLDDPTP